jgi:hypothetical protein
MKPQYLGDGVYVSRLGPNLVLTTGHHDPDQADNVIALEPFVLENLRNYLGKELAEMLAAKANEITIDLGKPDDLQRPQVGGIVI